MKRRLFLFSVALIALSACATTKARNLGSSVYAPSGFTGTGPITINANTLQWAANQGSPTLTQATATSGPGVPFLVQGQNAAVGSAANGGNFDFFAGLGDGAGLSGNWRMADQNVSTYIRGFPRDGVAGSIAMTTGTNGIALTTTGQINLSAATGIGGPSGTPLAFLPVTITTPTTGTLTLSAAQIAASRLRLSMSLTGNLTIVFPNQLGSWRVSLSGVTFNAHTIAFQSGSTTSATVASITTTSQFVDVETYGTNTIDVGTL